MKLSSWLPLTLLIYGFCLPSVQAALDAGPVTEQRDVQTRFAGSELGIAGLEHWQFELDLDATVEQETGFDESGQGAALDSFLFTGEGDRLDFRLGNHQPTEKGLLFDGKSHRGLSADAQLDAFNSDLSVFGIQGSAEDVAEGHGGYAGGIWRSRFDTRWSDMSVSAGYISGRFQGGALSDGRRPGQSTGYSVGVDSVWWDDRLQLDMEKAITRFSAGREETGRITDGAYRAALTFDPDLGRFPLDWRLGAETTDVGSDYRSPGNQPLVRDQSMDRVFSRLAAGRWAVDGSVGVREENTSRRDMLPAARHTEHQVNLNYQAPEFFGTRWLESPIYDLGLTRVVTDDLSDRPMYTPRDRVKHELTLASRFANPLGSLSLGYSASECRGREYSPLDTRADEVFADATLTLSDRLWIQPSGQLQRERRPDRDVIAYHSFFGFTADAWLIPEQLSWRQKVEFNRTRGVTDPLLARNDGRRHISGELHWKAFAPVHQWPGMDLNLSVSADQTRVTRDERGGLDSYQILLSVESPMPGG